MQYLRYLKVPISGKIQIQAGNINLGHGFCFCKQSIYTGCIYYLRIGAGRLNHHLNIAR